MGGATTATGAGARSDVTIKLSQLQNFCKRDPDGYREEYDTQVRRLESELAILSHSAATAVAGEASSVSLSSSSQHHVIELIQFAAAVSSSSYKGEESDRIANMLMKLLTGIDMTANDKANATATLFTSNSSYIQLLHRDVRKSVVSALILMRNKGTVEPLRLLQVFFTIMATLPDKALREILYRHIVNDVRNINKKGKRDDKVNRAVQTFLHRIVSQQQQVANEERLGGDNEEDSSTDIAAKRATDMCCELYRRRVWTDDRTVAILATAVQSKNTTIMCRAIRFFLGIEEKMAQDEREKQEEEFGANVKVDYHKFSKKTAARKRDTERQIKNRKKAQQKKENEDWMESTPEHDKGVEASKKLYPAIEMLRDPQGLAEAVFKRLRSAGSVKFEVKMLMINFVTRLVGNHELLLLPLYPFLQKYMGGHQRDVTAVLAYTVQACHENVPPDEVYGILKTIAHNFITERCSEEQMAVGINAARAICARVPSVLSIEESQESAGATAMDIEAFVRDLAAFANHRDRSVSIAGKAFTNFVREVHPALLQGKQRGLKGTALHKAGTKPLRYGEKKVALGVEGADLLAEYEAKKAAAASSNGDADDTSDVDDSASESGEWQDVDEEDDGEEALNEEDQLEEEELEEGEEEEEEEEEAPDLVLLGEDGVPVEGASSTLDLSKMTEEEREKLKQKISANRIFSASDFAKMRKLVEREKRAKRDPREAARRKRAIARGQAYDELSDDSEAEDEPIRIAGAVNPEDIMAEAKRKRQSKAEKLEKIIAGRSAFESKQREGGSTNVEKKRKKNFVMSKFSRDVRGKGTEKGGLKRKKQAKILFKHEAKKRRRKV